MSICYTLTNKNVVDGVLFSTINGKSYKFVSETITIKFDNTDNNDNTLSVNIDDKHSTILTINSKFIFRDTEPILIISYSKECSILIFKNSKEFTFSLNNKGKLILFSWDFTDNDSIEISDELFLKTKNWHNFSCCK